MISIMRLNVNYSTFTKTMQQRNYIYVKRRNQYFKFIDTEEAKEEVNSIKFEEELQFSREHMDKLKTVLYISESVLILDEEVYAKDIPMVVKSVKVNEKIYNRFAELCEERFNHLKMNDLISQAMLDFYIKYKK
ncbi:hypothetical protein FNE59_08705 [Bacillus thuringiensis]|uniref:hypothetical protein n=1 Tax=Bacillus cereus group TaxID=86661 RepID=UPI001298A817|nr:hypothetical protein [Bacillus thuringiensis]MDR5045725.1 hypothetical protein [Bacillus thuringiensis]MEB8859464.1 hypothetical protein [Bacillus cereus]MEC2469036.1 hypothetical protein [Bacillus cereus]MRC85985.1 hypothetical protein [Bacillus thuringiensis]